MLVLAVGYLAANGLLYLAVLRQYRWARKEKGIFAYQVVSFVLFVLLIAFAAVRQMSSREAVLWICVAWGLHGIFSLTFLELWSLTEGSYSLSILIRIASEGGPTTVSRLEDLSTIGAKKSEDRNAALMTIGLLTSGSTGRPKLTLTGRLTAVFFRGVVTLTNGRPLNQ